MRDENTKKSKVFYFFSNMNKISNFFLLLEMKFNILTVFMCLVYLMKLSWSKKMVRKFFNIKCKTEDTTQQRDGFASGG